MSFSRIFQFPISSPPCTLPTLSRFFYRKDSLNYIQEYPDGTAVRITQKDVLSTLKAENNIEQQKDLDLFLYKLRHGDP